jgi:hypothetical protein
MALSGSFYKNVSSHWRLYATWSGSQSVSGNYTNITLRLYWQGLDQYGTTYSTAYKDGATTINGSTDTFGGSGMGKLTGSESKLIQTHTVRVYHNSDGTKSTSLSAYFDVEMTLDGVWIGRVSISDSITLDTIPRASSLSTDASWVAGDFIRVSVSRHSSSFRHEAEIYVKNTSGAYDWVAKVDVSSSKTSVDHYFSVAQNTEIFSLLAGRSSAETKLQLQTFSGTTHVGSKDYLGTVTAPSPSTLTSGTDRYVYVDQAIALGISRNDSEFTHTLKIYANGNNRATNTLVKTITGVTTSYTVNFTQAEMDSIYNLMPNTTEIDGNVEIFTYYNGVEVRSYTNNDINFHVRNSHPQFKSSTIYYADNTSLTSSLTGDVSKIVQGVSAVRVLLPVASMAEAKNGSSMVNYIAVLGGQQKTATYTQADIYFYFDPIDTDVDQTVTIKAVDSRGYVSEISRTVTMVPYQPPTLNATAKRTNGFDDETTLLANGQMSSVLGNNSIKSVKYRYKKTTEATSVSTWAVWSSFTVTPTNLTYVTNSVPKTFLNTASWNVEFLVEDQLGSRKTALVVSTGKPIMFIDSVLKTVGIGKFSTANTLDVGGNASFDGTVRILGAHSIFNGADLNWYNLKNVWEAYIGKLNVSTDANITGTVTANKVVINNVNDAQGGSTAHAFTIGNDTTGQAIKMDGNEISSFADGLPAGLHVNPDGGIVTFNNSVSGYQKSLTIQDGQVVQENKTYPSLVNGYANYSTYPGYELCSFFKDKNGVVHIQGLVKNATDGTIFTLPVGYRPRGQEIHWVNGAGASARIDIYPHGDVNKNGGGVTGSWLSLAGLSFYAEN